MKSFDSSKKTGNVLPDDTRDIILKSELSSIPLIQNWEEDADDFKKLVECLPVIVIVYQYPRVVYANPFCQRLYGYSLQEMQQMNFWDFVHPDQREQVKSHGTARLQGRQAPSAYEIKILRKNGEVIWADAFFIVTTVRGKKAAIIGGVDITENKRLKEDLQKAKEDLEARVQQRTDALNQKTKDLNRKNQELLILNQKLNNVVRHVSEGVIIVDPSHNIEILNPFDNNTFGESSSELQDILKNYIASDKRLLIKRLFNKNESFQEEEILLSTPGGPLAMLASGTPILNEKGSVEIAVIVLRPIKEVHRLVNRFSGARARFRFRDIITNDPGMLDLINRAKFAASSMSSILIEGESGTGKELFAQAIHNESPRNKGPFLAVNCGAIPRELIGSELFGYDEGAFTGAKKRGNPGKFELASGGTLFLDEIGDMPLDHQATLLRVIQEKTITRIGGHREIPVDIRIICATNKELIDEVKNNNFRRDLYYRLNVINIRIPALRERPDDIELLFGHFLKMEAQQFTKTIKIMDNQVLKCLITYSWPGNIRELQNVAERIANTLEGDFLEIEHIPPEVRGMMPVLDSPVTFYRKQQQSELSIKDVRDLSRLQAIDKEKNKIIELLNKHNGNISSVAKELGVSRTTVYKKIRNDTLRTNNK
jgi:PAS domain S-box-containing protein